MADEQSQDKGNENQEGAGGEWLMSLPEDLRQDENIKGYASLEELAKGHINAQKLIGRKRALPDEADLEGWKGVWKDLGWPETTDGYEIARPQDYPKEAPYDDKLETAFKVKAHELGLSGKQARALYDWYVKTGLESHQGIMQEMQRYQKQAEESLRQEWGKNYEANVDLARRTMRTYADATALQAIQEGAGNDPRLVKMFAKIGAAMGEDKLVKGDASAGSSLAARKQEILRHPGLMDDRHPDHKALVKELEQIFKREAGEL
jgi:hypothetical protein